ncbi:glycosyltransferase [Candidatus Woesearchaeota archaeon]|nr:glycosyltransferase [Candidatus Woesearchaeota archaeon]
MKLSIVIPAYNEELRIENKISSYYKFFNNKLSGDFEIIVVPNNCSDNTAIIVEKCSKKYKNLKYKTIPYYVGKGGAVLEGFRISEGDLVGFVDADESTNAQDYYNLYINLNNYDGIIASRSIKGAKINIEQPFIRRFVGACFRYYVMFLFGFSYRDTQCGAKIFRKNVVKCLIKENYVKKWAFDIDLLYTCKRHNFKIREFPTVWTDNADSKLSPFKQSVEMALDALKLRIYHL